MNTASLAFFGSIGWLEFAILAGMLLGMLAVLGVVIFIAMKLARR